MFELFSADRHRAPHRGTLPVLVSTAVHVIVVASVLAIPILYVSADVPEVPDVLAFVAAAPPPPPPPPPPPAPAAKPSTPKAAKPTPVASLRAAPVEAPRAIVEEARVDEAIDEGVPGGVEGGIPGGVVGGVVGGLVADLPPPPPPPPPPPAPAVQAPLRIGGDLKAPALIERVDPEYPLLALRARVQGIVILETVVDRQGRVADVRVLRSIPLLDQAAIAAVQQWRYSPLLLNGRPERFVLTVSVSFSLSTEAG
jgi:protein TonB